MDYRVHQVPNTQHSREYKVISKDSKHETSFSFSKDILSTWGNPTETELKTLMVAYVKKHNWPKEPVTICEKSPKNLNQFIASLNQDKKK